ncbi:MAG: DUF3592 domain-containing protein [Dysgonamonadaceae bacterium]|jgi:hypothetical protein|nr:DUF3592 domain-containing protein [Dysgonamonadaceae bacterium]
MLWIINICAGIGIILIVRFIYIFILSKRTKKWEITKGEIISSKIQESLDFGAGYRAVIRYKYTIEEKEYLSNRIFYGDSIQKNSPKSAKTLVNKYINGEKVTVYYNPQYPNKSVLETGVHAVIYRALIAGILLLLLSIVILTKQSFLVSSVRLNL